MRRVLVTGGAGFVGVPLLAELARRGDEVAVLDDFSGAARERLEPLGVGEPLAAGDVAATLLEADLRDRTAVAQAVLGFRPDAIVHLAARHYIPWCEANPAETHAVNVDGTANLLDAAGIVEVERILLASTADVYLPSTVPHAETDAVGATSVYGASKLAAERLADGHPGARALRLFNVYGSGETNPHVLPEILDQLRRGDVLRLGNTEARRDWLYVEDAARAIADLLDMPGDDPVNLAGGRAASVDELIALVAGITGRELRVERDPERMRPSDRPVLAADLKRLRELLPDLRLTPLDEGLRRTLAAERLDVR